jgi:DUF971 family protein
MKAPDRIELDHRAGTLSLLWPDEPPKRFAYAALRRACRCAQCRRLRIEGAPIPVGDGVLVVRAEPMGYGVQLVFSDQHARGIYPWSYFDELASTDAELRASFVGRR